MRKCRKRTYKLNWVVDILFKKIIVKIEKKIFLTDILKKMTALLPVKA